MVKKYKIKKSKLPDLKSLEKISKHLLEAAEPSAPEASDDEAPEEVGFGASKDKAIEERKKIKGTIKEIKAGKKLKRMKLQKRNQAQKKEKLKDLDRLPDSLLQNLPSYDEPKKEKAVSPHDPENLPKTGKLKRKKISKKKVSEFEDGKCFIQLQKNKTTNNIKVTSLEKQTPNPTMSAVNFREQMLYGGKISRHSVTKVVQNLRKRRL